MAATGIAIGAVGAAGLSKAVRTLIYNVNEPVSFVSTAVLLAAVTLGAGVVADESCRECRPRCGAASRLAAPVPDCTAARGVAAHTRLMTTVAHAVTPIATTSLEADPGFEARWSAWQLRGVARERATRARARILLPAFFAIAAVGYFLLTR